MATVTALSSSLREKLAALTRRIRWLQALRGVALLLFTLALTAGAALLADAWLDLPGWGRGVLLSAWGCIGIAVAIAGLVVPLARRLRPETLAVVIEAKYPALAERLTTTVELADAADAYHGSPALIALLKEDTEARTRPLNFLGAVPGCPALRVTAALAVLVLFSTPALIWPSRFGDLAQRFLMPWYSPPIYTFDISPDATVVARGRPLTLSVQITPRNDRVPLPRQSILVKTDADGRTDRLRMTADRSDAFSINFNVTGDFRYHIEADGVASLPRDIQAVEPVALEPDSPTVTITPPAYAQHVVPVRNIHGLADLSELQHSKVRFDFRFTQPVVSARLEKVDRDARKQADKERESIEVSLLPDRLGGFIELPMRTECGYRLRLVGAYDIGTDFAPVWLSVKIDQSPAFLKPERDSDQRERHALAYDNVPLDIVLVDDYGVDRADVEYRIQRAGQKDAEKMHTESIALEGRGTLQATGRYLFPLNGKVKEGDTIRYRIKAQDNRRVPEAKLGPNVVYYPADHWLTLKIAARGAPLQEQDVVAQRDDINQRIEALQKALRGEREQLFSLKYEAQRVTALNPAQVTSLNELKKDNRSIEDSLRELARDTAQTAALLPIAEKAQDIAAREMRKSGAALNQAGKETNAVTRDRHFSNSDQELLSAIQRLENLKKDNNQLAHARLDQAKLDMLAHRQQDLADRTAEQALKDPVKDPASQANLKDLQREQEQLARELQRLSEQSEPLRNAQDANRAQQAEQLAEQLREMARQQRELAQAFDQNTQQQALALADLARKQQELARQTQRLAQETQQPAQTARTTPLRPEEAQKAADALQQGDAGEAVRRQERAAQELDRVAAALDRAIDLSRDPREAARQLAALQESLRQRLAEAAKKQKDPAAKPLAERLQAVQAEQQAIQRAAEQLSVPAAQHPSALKQRQVAADRAGQAAEALKNQDTKEADARMTEARKALEQLANQLPSLQQRQRQAQAELAQLRRQQDQIAGTVDRALEQAQKEGKAGEQGRRDLAQRLQDAARAQAETAERLGRLDAAGQEVRQERAQDALNRALADLMDARKQDLQASQQEARRQLERLQQALAGQKPADELARDLARRQQELAEQARQQAADPQATPRQRADLQQRQRRIAQETQALQASEAPQRQAEAVEATRRAQQAADAQPAAPQTPERLQEAARALDRLAQQLNGNESDAARAERLARQQAQVADEAERRTAQKSRQRVDPETQRRQQQIAQEARELRAGDAAPEAEQKALDALARAQQAARPAEQALAQRQAADALRELAERLAGRTDAVAQAAELARQQRELADEVARQNRPEQAVQAAERQAELARRLERLDARPAADAQKQAAEQMARAQKNLERTASPADVREHVAKAADAAEALARQLAQAQAARPSTEQPAQRTSLKPPDQSGRALAQELAKQQRALAQATQQAQREAGQQPGEQGKQALQQAMNRLAEQQRQLNQQASQLPANQAQPALQQARQVMDKAQQALANADGARAQQKQQEAAGALERLAQQLPERTSPSTAQRGPADPQAAPQGLPTRQQAEQARQLAEQQRELQREVQRALEQQRTAAAEAVRDNPAGALVQQQQAIARQAGELARNVGQEQGREAPPAQAAQQAAQSAQQTSNQMQNGALPQAQKAGQQTAQELRQLAQQLAQTPRPANSNPSAPDSLQQARQLAQQQEELNRRLEPLMNNPHAQRAQQLAQQQELQRQAAQAAQRLGQLAQQMNNAPQARAAGQQAAATTQQAAQTMQQAQNQAQQGNTSSAQQNQQDAAQRLDQAAQRTGESAKQMAAAVAQRQPQSPSQASAQTGQSLQQAQGQMAQAQSQLGQNQSQAAQGSMQQAASSLQQAANQMAQQPGQPGQPAPNSSPGQTGVAATGQPDLSLFSKDMKKYAGKPWGELPGELRTRLLQQMKEKYGEDYARIIKLYFEQVAETKKK